MPKKHKPIEKHFRLSQDAVFFLSKMFPWIQPELSDRVRSVNTAGNTLTRRALEASCECIEAGFLRVDEETQVYYLLKLFTPPPLKLQRIREMYQAFQVFTDPEAPEAYEHVPFDFVPLIQTMMALSRIQTDVLCALEYKDLSDPVARLHVQHAIQAIQRLATEGVKGLETVLESPN